MAKGHVGRPTNEEVAARKRKKLLKLLVPGTLVAVGAVMLIGNSGLKELMGNETCNYVCEDGWKRDGGICYQESDATSVETSYVLGDALDEYGNKNYDGKATFQDWNYIKNKITSKDKLDNIQEAVYDLNQDGVVNNDDISGYATATDGSYTIYYTRVCPKDKTEVKEENGIKIITTTTYALDENDRNVCQLLTKVRSEKKAVCAKNNKSTVKPTQNVEPESKEAVEMKCPDSKMTKYYDNKIGAYVCEYDDISPRGITEDNTDTEDKDGVLSSDEHEDVLEETSKVKINSNDQEDLSYTRQSNYLNYAAENNAVDDTSITIYTKSSLNGTAIDAEF